MQILIALFIVVAIYLTADPAGQTREYIEYGEETGSITEVWSVGPSFQPTWMARIKTSSSQTIADEKDLGFIPKIGACVRVMIKKRIYDRQPFSVFGITLVPGNRQLQAVIRKEGLFKC